MLPVLGPDAALAFVTAVRPAIQPIRNSTPASTTLVVAVPLFAILAMLIAILAFGVARDVRWWLAGSYAVVTLGSLLGAVVVCARSLLDSIDSGARYGYVPGVLFVWLLLLNVRPGRQMQNLICAALVAFAVGNGAWQWRRTLRWHASWPVWSAEVTAWQLQPERPLRIWPPGWTIRLVPRHW